MQSFPAAPDGHPHFTSSSSTIEVEVKSSSPLYFIGDFANHFTGRAAPWLGKSIRCTFQRGPSCMQTGTMGGRERPHRAAKSRPDPYGLRGSLPLLAAGIRSSCFGRAG